MTDTQTPDCANTYDQGPSDPAPVAPVAPVAHTTGEQTVLMPLGAGAPPRRNAVPSIPPIEKHQQELHDLLCSGWSAARVCSHMKTVKKVDIPLGEIIAFQNSIPQEEMLPVSDLSKRFLQLDLQIDAVGEMARLLRLSGDRLGVALTLEQASNQRIPYVDIATRNYWQMLREYVETRQTLGELPAPNKSIGGLTLTSATRAGDDGKTLPTLRAIMMVEASLGGNDDDDDDDGNGNGDVNDVDIPVGDGGENGAYPGGPQSYKRVSAAQLLPE